MGLMRLRPGRKSLRIVGILVALAAAALFLYSCATARVMQKEIDRTPRDPITGVVTGTEAITLHPAPGSDTATSRTACLMIHGFLSARTDFADLGERLAQCGFTVRMMRLPGHGTHAADFAYQPDGALLKAARQELRALRQDFDHVDVIGFSMGGSIATLLASSEPVDRVVLVAPYYRVTYCWYYVLRPEMWNAALGHVLPYIIRPTRFIKLNDKSNVGKFFFYGIVPSGGTSQLVALGREARRPETLEKITCPVLLVHSKGDEAASPKAARQAFERMASHAKQALWLKRSNHIILWDFDREEAKTRIEEFLTAPAPRLESEKRI